MQTAPCNPTHPQPDFLVAVEGVDDPAGQRGEQRVGLLGSCVWVGGRCTPNTASSSEAACPPTP
eukprot:1151686-Pelagomonas_calceolata.AAC.11